MDTNRYENDRLVTRRLTPRFVGVDGEGMGDGADHDYYVLRAGTQLLRTGRPLTSDECLDFLSRLDPRNTYVVYSGNYDFTMILRGLPEDTVRALLDRDSRRYNTGHVTKYRPVQYGDYKLEYLPHKNLTVQYDSYKPIEIHDVFSFFQASFVETIERWQICTNEEQDIIRRGKNRRSDADVLDDEADEYNTLECVVLARLMDEFDVCVRRVGLSAVPYEGPGALAASAYRLYVATPHRKKGEDEKPPQPPDDMPYTAAYYGGRFEITAHGPIDQPVYEYDIVSAYPDAQSKLPCVWHSRWVHDDIPNAKVRLGHVVWHTTGTANVCPFPVRRKDGSVIFPRSGSGWYWSYEWDQDNLGPVDVVVDDVWSLTNDCQCKPYAWIRNLYQARHEYKSRGATGQSFVLKYVLNSLYGKLAQTIGQAPWQNLAYAGMITSMCRSWLYQAALQCPDSTLMMATDGIYTTEQLNLALGSQLGEWEETLFNDVTLVRPGIYFTSDGAKTKTRGISSKALNDNRDRIVAAFEDGLDDYLDNGRVDKWTVPLLYPGLVSLKLAYAQNRPKKAGYFGTLNHSVCYNPAPKRVGAWLDRDILRSCPPAASIPFESVPYSPRYSDADMAADVSSSAPSPDMDVTGVAQLELW